MSAADPFAHETTTVLTRATLATLFPGSSLCCYGLGDSGELPLRQRAMLDRFLLPLTDSPGEPGSTRRAVLIGPSLAGCSEHLKSGDWEVSHWDPLPAPQQEPERDSPLTENPLSHTHTDDGIAPASLDAIVIEGSVQRLDQLALLQQARYLLKPSGELLLLGEFLNENSTRSPSALAALTTFHKLIERLGFVVIDSQNHSVDAKHSCAELIRLAASSRTELVGRTFGSEAQFDAWLTELTRLSREFDENQRELHNFRLRWRGVPEGEYVEAEYGDIDSFEPAEVAGLFEASFDKPFDAALWDWKYAQNNGRSVVARQQRGGPVVSHYGGAPRKIDYFGETALAIQVCDVMVLPEERRYYGKSSLFFKSAATFLEREIGYHVEHLLGFGFPNQKAMNIAKRVGLYEKTDEFVELVFKSTDASGLRGEALRIDPTNTNSAALIDDLWRDMRKDFSAGIIGHRDFAYVDYRYCRHPHAQVYQHWLLVDAGQAPLALAVVKESEQDLLLMDLIGPLKNQSQAIAALLGLLHSRDSGSHLKFWLTRGWLDRFPGERAIVNELGIEIPCNSWSFGPDASRLQGVWWLTAGDMDFI